MSHRTGALHILDAADHIARHIAVAPAHQNARRVASVRHAQIAGAQEELDSALLVLRHAQALRIFRPGIEAGFSVIGAAPRFGLRLPGLGRSARPPEQTENDQESEHVSLPSQQSGEARPARTPRASPVQGAAG